MLRITILECVDVFYNSNWLCYCYLKTTNFFYIITFLQGQSFVSIQLDKYIRLYSGCNLDNINEVLIDANSSYSSRQIFVEFVIYATHSGDSILFLSYRINSFASADTMPWVWVQRLYLINDRGTFIFWEFFKSWVLNKK